MTEAAVAGQVRGLGYPTPVVRVCRNGTTSTTLVPGDVVRLDELITASALTTNTIPGDPGSSNTVVVVPTGGRVLVYARHGIVQETIEPGLFGNVLFRGFTDMKVDGGVFLGQGVVAQGLSTEGTPITGTTGRKILAIARAALGGAGQIPVEFDGMAGFGQDD